MMRILLSSFFIVSNHDAFVKSPFPPPLAGGDEGEGILIFNESINQNLFTFFVSLQML
jgi:hypothetical protein